MNHECQEEYLCCCSSTSLEPDEYCPVHGGCRYTYPPKCYKCGKFIIQDKGKLTIEHVAKLIFDRTGVYNGWYFDDITRGDIAYQLAERIVRYVNGRNRLRSTD